MSRSIGIKLADGAFYRVLEEGKPANLSMELTTAKDGQKSVRVIFFRSGDDTIENADYVDTLRLDGILPHPGGEPNLRLDLSLDKTNTLQVKITDPETGNTGETRVSLDALPIIKPAFAAEEDGVRLGAASAGSAVTPDFSGREQDDLISGLYSRANGFQKTVASAAPAAAKPAAARQEEQKKSRVTAPALICIICAVICVFVFLLFLFVIPSRINIIRSSRAKEAAEIKEEVAEITPVPQQTPEPVPPTPPPGPPPEVDQVIYTDKPITIVPVVSGESEKVPEPRPAPEPENKPEPVRYRIKWGDTLWDIAKAYYRDPWRYRVIAEYNGIKNPDRIISGTYIMIPPR